MKINRIIQALQGRYIPKQGIALLIPTGGYEAGSTRAKTGAEKGIIKNLLEMINEL